MTTRALLSILSTTLLAATTATASADDANKQDKAKATEAKPSKKQTKAKTADATKPAHDSKQVMQITQESMRQIAAAEQALERGDTKAAQEALDKSERSLEKLYDTPALAALINELDEAIDEVQGEEVSLEAVDLAPLAATMRSYQAFLDPEVVAGITKAQESAKAGDERATADALQMARNRMAIEVAFLPVEEAYVRVLAAQQAIDDGKQERAQRLLRNLPIVVSEVQVSTPLVPVRFKLQAAAVAAEEGNWKRAQALVKEATRDVQAFEKLAKGGPMGEELSSVVDEIEQLNRQIAAGERPGAARIREVAQRTRTVAE